MLDLASLRLGFAFTLGAGTFFAPCAFPLLPGYVAYFVGQTDDSRSRSLGRRLGSAALVGMFTSLGFFVVYAVLAGVAVAVGTRVLAHVSVLELVVGAVLVALGTGMALGKLQLSAHVPLPERRRSPAGYFLFGVVYAAAAAGCTGPLFVAIASFSLTSGPVSAVVTLAAYAAGMSVLMVAVTVLTALGRETVVRRLSANTDRITRVAGVVLVVAGLVQIYYFLFVFDGIATLSGL